MGKNYRRGNFRALCCRKQYAFNVNFRSLPFARLIHSFFGVVVVVWKAWKAEQKTIARPREKLCEWVSEAKPKLFNYSLEISLLKTFRITLLRIHSHAKAYSIFLLSELLPPLPWYYFIWIGCFDYEMYTILWHDIIFLLLLSLVCVCV